MTVFKHFKTSVVGLGLFLGATTWSAAQTPVLLKDINSGTSGSGFGIGAFAQFLPVGSNKVFFLAKGTNGVEPHVSDGTTAGTNMIKDVFPGILDGVPFSSSHYQVYNPADGKVYFTALDNNLSNLELFVSNGTAAGTVLTKDINPGTGGAGIAYLCVYNGKVYFTAGGTDGTGLYVTDGTTAGTKLVKAFTGYGSKDARYLVVHNEKLYFGASNNGNFTQQDLYESDGTEAGTVLINDFSSSSSKMEKNLIGSKGIYSAIYSVGSPTIWFYNTVTKQSVSILSTGSGDFTTLTTFKGKDYFILGKKLYVTDGTAAGTKELKAFDDNIFDAIVKTDTKLFVRGKTAATGDELWTYDPTAGMVCLDIA